MSLRDDKALVHEFWSANPCGSQYSRAPTYTLEFFEEVERHRYTAEPDIFSFAQFPRFHGKRVLEAGIGLGTDFLQWVRSGARAHGIDLTLEGARAVRTRLALYHVRAESLLVGDCEALPYRDGAFDLAYCWGVVMHTPDSAAALRELVRVTLPGGRCKLMLYNRRSLPPLYLWVRHALVAGRPWKSLSWCLANFQESPGTKAFTREEVLSMLERLPVRLVSLRTLRTHADTLEYSRKPWVRLLGRIASWPVRGHRFGWFMIVELEKER